MRERLRYRWRAAVVVELDELELTLLLYLDNSLIDVVSRWMHL
jgi:hypothetical protein